MLSQHPTELRADLQRYYGVCLDDVGRGVSVEHAAALAACLPPGSATMAAIDPRAAWTDVEWLLLAIANMLSEEKIDPFDNDIEEGADRESYEVDEYERLLALPRKEADRHGYGVG